MEQDFIMYSRKRWLLIGITAAFHCIASSHELDDEVPIFSGLIDKERSAMQESDNDQSPLDEYDFIIVGASAAGCVLANRLTEVKTWNVLLLEAGGEGTALMDIPNLGAVIGNEDTNWQYKTVPSETKYKSFNTQQLLYNVVGKVMGGSTSIDYTIDIRGKIFDYDNWINMGNSGWSYDDVLPYFRKFESRPRPIEIPELKTSTYHSTTGNIKGSCSRHVTEYSSTILKALKETGYPEVDYNGENQSGCSRCQTTTENGTRWSGSRGYLHPIRSRYNLHVQKRSFVTRLLINENRKAAFGVTYTKGGKNYTVCARKGVILPNC